jgi:predicted transcriptional regulator
MKSDLLSRSQVLNILEEWKSSMMDEINNKLKLQYELITEESKRLQETDIILQKNLTSMYDQIMEQLEAKLKASKVTEFDKRLDEQMKMFTQLQEEVRVPYQSITLK